MECARLVAAFRSWPELCCPGQLQLENAKLRQVATLQTALLIYAQASAYIHYHDTGHLSEALKAEGFEILDVRYKDSPAQSTPPTRDFFMITRLNR